MASYVYDSTDSYPFSSVDNGFVYGAESSTEDFGAVNVASTSQESYDTITVVQGNDTPFGFYTVNGSAAYWKPKRYTYSSSSDNLFTSEDYGDIVLIERYGQLSESPSEILDWGSLGTTTSSEDFGVVTTFTASTPDTIEDYGSITGGNIIREDRYLIITNQSILAMGAGYTTNTSGASYTFTANTPDNTQLFSISGALISKVVFTWVGSGNPFEISGSANEIVKAFSTVATSGPLRLDVTSSEVFVKTFSFDAVVPFNILDYGSVPTSPTLDVDFGFVSQASFGGEKDYGLITNIQEVTPYGLYESSGVISESFTKGLYTGQGSITIGGEVILPLAVNIIGQGGFTVDITSIEKNTEDYVASGSLFTASGAAECIGSNPPEDTVLYTYSGFSVEKFTANTPEDFAQYTLSGFTVEKFTSGAGESTQIFIFGGFGVEKNTEVYIGEGTFSSFSGAAESVTYRYSFDSFVPFFEFDYGSVAQTPTNEINLGSVALPNTGGELDYGIITYNDTIFPYGLWTTSGQGVDSFSKNIVDNGGAIVISGEVVLPLAVSIIGTGSIVSSGSAIEKNTEDYVASGSLFATSGAAECTRSNPPEDTVLYTYSGFSVEKFRANPPEDFALYTLSGFSTEKFTSRAGESTQIFTLSGSAVEKNTEDYVASGSLFATSGAAECTRSNPPEDTSLFAINVFSTEKNTESYTGNTIASGHVLSGGYTNLKFTSGGGETTQLFALSGSAVEKNTEDYVGTGASSISGTGVEKNTEVYVSELAQLGDLFADYGDFSAATESEDYGLITSVASNVDYRYLTSDFYDIAGAAVEKFTSQGGETTQLFTLSGTAVEKFTSGGGESTQIFAFSGDGVEKNTEVYIGEGTFSSFSGAAESVTYRYSFDSFVPFFEFDYGSIAQSPTNEINLGSVSAPNTGGEQDYGLITYTDSVFPYGLWTTSGQGVEIFSKNIVDNGGSIIISGAVVLPLAVNIIGQGGFTVDITSIEKNTEDYVASGSLFATSGAAEVFGANPPESTQAFTTSGTAVEKFTANTPEDFAQYTFSGAAVEKFTTQGGETTQLFALSGSAVEKNTEDYVGTGTATVFGSATYKEISSFNGSGFIAFPSGAAESFGANPPENIQLFGVSGTLTEKNTESYVGSGTSVFTGMLTEKNTEDYVGLGTTTFSGTKVEKNTESYFAPLPAFIFANVDNGQIDDPAVNEDYGLITQAATETENLQGLVLDYLKVSGFADESFIAQSPENTQLFTISGDHVEKFVASPPETAVTFSYTGNAVEKNTEDYVGTGTATFDIFSQVRKTQPSYVGFGFAFTANGSAEVFGANPPENTQLFQISGAAVVKVNPRWIGEGTISVDVTSVEKHTEAYIGAGSLFNIGDGSEARTYVYDETTSVLFLELDYGSLTQPVDTINDFGQITNFFNEVDYGTVVYIESVFPFGSAFFSGSAIESFAPQTPENTQLFALSGAAVEKFTSQGGETTQLFTLSGNAVEKNTEDYVGTGVTIFISGTKVEKNTEVFTGSGSAIFTGTRVEKNTESYVGDNPIYTLSGSAVEKFATQGGESTQLFILSGNADQKNTESYVATGSLFSIVDGSEARTYIYVAQSPDTPATIITETYDDITQTANAYENYGFITDVVTTSEDYGITDVIEFFVLKGAADESFNKGLYTASGSINISGVGKVREIPKWVGGGTIAIAGTITEKNTESYTGTGSIAALSGAAEAFGANPPENTQAFTYSGSAVEKFRANPPEDFAQYTFGNFATESFTAQTPDNTVAISIDVDSVERNTESYTGTGSIAALSGAAEAFGANPPESTQAFTTSGTAVEKFRANPPEDFAQYTFGNFATESFTAQTPDNTVAISIDVDSVERNTESYVGTGNAFTFVDSDEKVTFDYTVEIPEVLNEYRNLIKDATVSTEDYGLISVAADSFDDWGATARSYIEIIPTSIVRSAPREFGVGNLFAVSGAAEVFGANPLENTQIFSYTGTATEKNTESYVGVGQSDLTGDAGEDLVKTYEGSGGLFNIGGSIFFIGYYPYVDYITLFTSGAASYIEVNAFNGTGTTSLTGDAGEDLVKTYKGSGGLFNIGGGSEARVYVYGSDVIIGFNEVDYGFITETPTADIDYSTITIGEIGGIFDYGKITFEETIISATGLVDISGAVYVTTSPAYYGSGTLTLSDTALERNTEAFNGTGTASLTGVGLENNTERYIGVGNLFTTGGHSEVFGANPVESTLLFIYAGAGVEKNTESYVGTGTATASGVGIEKNTEIFNGSGNLFTTSGAAEAFIVDVPPSTQIFNIAGYSVEKFTANPPEDFAQFSINVTSVEKNTEDYVGIGSVSIDITSVEKNTEVYVGTGTSTLSGVGLANNTKVYIGVGSLFTVGGSAERVRFNPPEGTQLFAVTGSITEKNTESYVGVGSTALTGAGIEKNTEVFVGTGSTALTGAGVEKNTEVYIGTVVSASFDGVAETKFITVYTAVVSGDGKYVVSVSSVERNTESYVGTGTATATGVGIEKNTEAFLGTGELFSFNGLAESFTVNPEKGTVLYTFVGAGVEKNTEKWVGTGTTTLSGTKIEKNTESYVGVGTETLGGAAVEKNTEIFNGSGNLFTTSGAAEVFGANPPENIVLFTYAGAAVERNTESYVGTGTETLTGTAVEKNTESYVGTGILNALSGAAEAYSAQKPENTVLFTFAGAGTERFIAQTPENTQLFKITGFSVERNTEAHFGTGTTTVAGTAVEKNTEVYNGTGTFTASGVGLESFAPVYIASGNLFTTSGSAESFGANSPEDTSLFTILGFAVERNTEAHFATGEATVTGTAVEKNTESYVGIGQLFSYTGAAESITVNPEENTVLFTFVGFAAESFSAQTPENTQLFEITGFSHERNTETYDGSGTLTASGDVYAPIFKSYFGSGSVFAINGAAESFGVNPPEDTVLYNFVGAATERNTEVYYGEEIIYVEIDSDESSSRIYTGFGSLSSVSGAAEVFGANPPENTQLFTYTGAATEKNTESYSGVGNINIDVSSTEKNTESYVGAGTLTTSGSVNVSETNIVIASGSLFTFYGASESIGVNPPESIVLFAYNGAAVERNTESYEGFTDISITGFIEERNTESYEGSGSLTFNGISDISSTNIYLGETDIQLSGTANEEYVPSGYRGRGTATISGASVESISEVFVASGSLFGVGGSAEATTNVVDSNIFATISGSAVTTKTNIVLGNGTLFTFNGVAESISRNPDTQTTAFVISGSSATVNNPYRPPRTYVSII